MCLKSCFHSLKSRPIQVNVSQICFHYLNNYSCLIILSTSWGYLKLISYIISDRRIPLLAGIPLCKSQELSRREHSTSQLRSIHHIPVTMHTPPAYGQWSVFDHSGDNQSAVLETRFGIWWPWYGQFEVGWLQPLQLWLGARTSSVAPVFVSKDRDLCHVQIRPTWFEPTSECRSWPVDWIGLDLFNDDTRPSAHISRPTKVNVSQSCFHSLNNYPSLIILYTSRG